MVSARRSELLPLQVPKRAAKLAITDLITTGEHCLQGGHERCPLVWLQGAGGVDHGDLLRIGDRLEYEIGTARDGCEIATRVRWAED